MSTDIKSKKPLKVNKRVLLSALRWLLVVIIMCILFFSIGYGYGTIQTTKECNDFWINYTENINPKWIETEISALPIADGGENNG